MLDAIKSLLESELINEEARQEIQEQWESKLSEARESVRAELREEFAQRYEHDRTVMAEALDRMVSEGLTKEIQQIAEEKAALAEDRVQFKIKMQENATKFNEFMVTKLASEINELRGDRQVQTEGMAKLEKFAVEALAKEIREFAEDKRDLVETKVRLVAEAKDKLDGLQKKFVSESATKVKGMVAKHLRSELSQLHEDIKVARENNFGRRIFEAFASEFTTTHLNENAVVRKLKATLEEKDKQIAEAAVAASENKKLIESREKQIRIIKESSEREKLMGQLLSPLNKEKATVMRDLLENVQTSRLASAFDKYLPAVLNNEASVDSKKEKLVESVKEVTGDKTARKVDESNIIDIKKLAGL